MSKLAALLVAIALADASGSAVAQTLSPGANVQERLGRISGIVTDEHGQPLIAADVEIAPVPHRLQTSVRGKGISWVTKTDEAGFYAVVDAPEGRYTVTVRFGAGGAAMRRALLHIGDSTSFDVTFADRAERRGRCASTVGDSANYGALKPLFDWLDAVNRHTPGIKDSPLMQVANWDRQSIESMLADVEHIGTVVEEAINLAQTDPLKWKALRVRAARFPPDGAPPATIRLRGHCFNIDEIASVFFGNETLKQGAVLHADVAELVGDDLGGRPVFVEDGRQSGRSRGTVHWDVARRLLDGITPRPWDDPDVRLWYRAVSAHLLRHGLLDEARAHLRRAQSLFASDPAFMIDMAYVHEKFASSAVQAAVDEMQERGIRVQVDSRRTELERAEELFRRAIRVGSEDSNLRLRLGYTLGALGRHEEAVSELRRASVLAGDDRARYLAELFLGTEEESRGRYADAAQHFDIAAGLFPLAQSPWLALAALARRTGDIELAAKAMERVKALGAAGAGIDDPRWFYQEPYLEDASLLMDRMRAIGTARGAVATP